MTVLLTLYLVLVLGFRRKPRKHRSKGTVTCVPLHWWFDSNLEYNLNTEVWNSFLILSCLGVFWTTVDAHAWASIDEIQKMLEEMKKHFENSDALLYAPPIIKAVDLQECASKFMHCYLLELNVTASEDDTIKRNETILQTIYTNEKKYRKCSQMVDRKIPGRCPDCEAFPVVLPPEFIKSMLKFLKTLLLNNTDCD